MSIVERKRSILCAAFRCYFDNSNGAAVAIRALMEALTRQGFSTAALTGTCLELNQDSDPAAWLAAQGLMFDTRGGDGWSIDARGLRAVAPIHYRLTVQNVQAVLCRSTSSRVHEPDGAEQEDFLRLFEHAIERSRPDVLINYGGDLLANEIRARARARGVAVVFALHNFSYHSSRAFESVDAVIVPSQFAADHYRKTLGLECTVLPNLIDLDRVRATTHDPRYVTFVNPSYEKGVYAFARIADELGRRRPDIPLLVVEGRGAERTLADCGLDLRVHGNVHMMGHTHDPRLFWAVSRVCLIPSLWWENQPLVAVEAMVNGIPVDRIGHPPLGRRGVLHGASATGTRGVSAVGAGGSGAERRPILQ